MYGTPVMLQAGWPFFARCPRSLVTRSLNVFTPIALRLTTPMSIKVGVGR